MIGINPAKAHGEASAGLLFQKNVRFSLDKTEQADYIASNFMLALKCNGSQFLFSTELDEGVS